MSDFAKSQQYGGHYKRAVDLDKGERGALHTALVRYKGQHYPTLHAQPKWAKKIGRGINSVYGEHPGPGQHLDRLRAEVTRPSGRHKGVHYGESVSSELEHHLERHINGHLVKNPVVVHAEHHPNAPYTAAAVPGHKSHGHGRVLINEAAFKEQHAEVTGHNLRDVVNHELVHAGRYAKQPHRFLNGKGGFKPHIGEEARADKQGVPGQGPYRQRTPGHLTAHHERAGADVKEFNRVYGKVPRKAIGLARIAKSEFVIRVQQHEPRHTYTEGKVHRDNKGRFASVGAAGATLAGAGVATMYGDITHAAHGILQQNRREGDATAVHFMDAARTGDKPRADKLAQRLKALEGESDYLIAARQKAALIAAGGAAVGLGGLYAHSRANRRVGHNEAPRPVAKSVGRRVGQKLDSLHITGEQARNAGVMGQIGAGAGVVAGAAIGAGVGAAAHHAAQGAGIGGAIGGALGGSAGAGAGLYAGRPSNAARRRKKLVGTAPTTLAKSFDGKKRGAVIGAGAGMATGQLIGVGARSAAQRARTEQGLTDHLADYKAAGAKAKMLDATGDFHRSPKGVAVMAAGGALTGAALVRHHQRKIAAQVDPIAKMDDDTKTKLARGGLIGAQLADVAAIKSAYHETTTARKVGTGLGASLSYGAKKAALPVVAGGLVASIGAERVMHSQAKKLKAANTANLKPRVTTTKATNP